MDSKKLKKKKNNSMLFMITCLQGKGKPSANMTEAVEFLGYKFLLPVYSCLDDENQH